MTNRLCQSCSCHVPCSCTWLREHTDQPIEVRLAVAMVRVSRSPVYCLGYRSRAA